MSFILGLRVRFLHVAITILSLVVVSASPGMLRAAIVGQYSLNCKHVSVSCRTPCVEINVCVDLPGKCYSKCISRSLNCDRSCDVQRVKGFCEPRNDCRDYVRDCREYDSDRQKCENRSNSSQKNRNNGSSGEHKGGNLLASVVKLVKNRVKNNGSDSYETAKSSSNGSKSTKQNSSKQSSNNNASNSQASTASNGNSNSRGSNGSASNAGTTVASASSSNSSRQSSNSQSSHQNSSSQNSQQSQSRNTGNSNSQGQNNNSSNQNSGNARGGNDGPSSSNSNNSNNSRNESSSSKGSHSKPFSQSSLKELSNHVLAFSVKADAGKSVLIEGLSFDHKRDCYGPQSGVVQYSFDGFETVVERFCFDLSQCWQSECWDFADFVLNPCDTVDFRFILKDALNWCYGDFCLTNVKVKGREFCDPPTSVPEPGSLSLAAMALVLGIGSKYRASRRKA